MPPITDTLKTAEEMRQAGFTDAQSKLLAGKFEESAQLISQDLKAAMQAEISKVLDALRVFEARINAKFEAIDSRFDALENRFDAKLETLEARIEAKIEGVRAEFHSELRKQTLTYVTILIAALSLSVATVKLFPNWF